MYYVALVASTTSTTVHTITALLLYILILILSNIMHILFIQILNSWLVTTISMISSTININICLRTTTTINSTTIILATSCYIIY
jgi:hypothetical protein